MEDLVEDEEAEKNNHTVVASNSQSSCYYGGRESDSKETRHQGETKSLSSETLRNLCRALNDPTVSVEVKKRIGLLLRQLQQRYLERMKNSTDGRSIASNKVTESFQAAVASGVVSRFEAERQRNIVKATQRPDVIKSELESMETFPRERKDDKTLTRSASLEVLQRVSGGSTKSQDETRPLYKTYSSNVNILGHNGTTDSSRGRDLETTRNSFISSSFVNVGTENRIMDKNLPFVQSRDSSFSAEGIPLKPTKNSVGIEPSYLTPTYQGLQEAPISSVYGVANGEESSRLQRFSSFYPDKNGNLPHKREEQFLRQSTINSNLKTLSEHEYKNFDFPRNSKLVATSSGTGSGSCVTHDYARNSSSAARETKRLRLVSAPQRDLQTILHPNYRTPFDSLEDAYRRLLPYHLCYVVESELENERKQEWEVSFDKVYKKLKQSFYQQEDRWKHITQLMDSEEKLDGERTTQQVIETSVLDEILALNFLLKETEIVRKPY